MPSYSVRACGPAVVTLANPAAVLLNPKKRGKPHAPACDRACVWLIENVAATHVRAHTRQVGCVGAAVRMPNLWRAWVLVYTQYLVQSRH